MAEVFRAALTALLSAAALFVLTRLMGERQISQMDAFDYVTGITIGSIAAELATEQEKNVLIGVTAMAVYTLLSVAISLLSRKSRRLRQVFTGKPVVLMENGALFRQNFSLTGLDLSKFLSLARAAGYFDLSDVQRALLEPNGAVSFQGATPQRRPPLAVVLDGQLSLQALSAMGSNENALRSLLRAQGYQSEKEVFLALLDDDGALRVYPRNAGRRPGAVFE